MLNKYTGSGKIKFNTLLFIPFWNPLDFGHVKFRYKFQSETYAEVVFWIKIVLCSITGILFVYWIYKLASHNNEHLVAEQRWMMVLLTATLFYQDPISLNSALQSRVLYIFFINVFYFIVFVEYF